MACTSTSRWEPIYTYDQVRSFCELISHVVVASKPDLFTTPRSVAKRKKGARVFRLPADRRIEDHQRTVCTAGPIPARRCRHRSNGARSRPGLLPQHFNIENAPTRFRAMGDLFRPVLEQRQRLETAIDAIQRLLSGRNEIAGARSAQVEPCYRDIVTPNPAGKKKATERFRDLWPDIWDLVRPRRHLLLAGFGLMIVNRVAGLVLPASTKFFIDDVIAETSYGIAHAALLLAVVGATAIQGVTSFSLTQLLSKAAQRLIADMRRRVQAHVGRLPAALLRRQQDRHAGCRAS